MHKRYAQEQHDNMQHAHATCMSVRGLKGTKRQRAAATIEASALQRGQGRRSAPESPSPATETHKIQLTIILRAYPEYKPIPPISLLNAIDADSRL